MSGGQPTTKKRAEVDPQAVVAARHRLHFKSLERTDQTTMGLETVSLVFRVILVLTRQLAANMRILCVLRTRDTLAMCIVTALLLFHGGLLAIAATKHSPTLDEPAHLVAGLSHWKFGRFELYRVNPPLARMVAALPVMAVGYKEDWKGFDDAPGTTPVFRIGGDFISANAERSVRLFTLARWACIPFSLAGGLFCYLWSRAMWRDNIAGILSLVLWCVEPNILAHGELITADCAAASFGLAAGYVFWRWLLRPTYGRAFVAGGLLGLAELSKLTWIILFGIWPALWLLWLWMTPRDDVHEPTGDRCSVNRQMLQLGGIMILGVYVLNLGYGFDES